MSWSPFHQWALALFICTQLRWKNCTSGVVLSRTPIIRCAWARIAALSPSCLLSAAMLSVSSGIEPHRRKDSRAATS